MRVVREHIPVDQSEVEKAPDLVGLSLSFCVLDILKGNVPASRVREIITGTNITDQEGWDDLLSRYKTTYWKIDPDKGEQIARQFITDGRIKQPLLDGKPAPKTIGGKIWKTAVEIDALREREKELGHEVVPSTHKRLKTVNALPEAGTSLRRGNEAGQVALYNSLINQGDFKGIIAYAKTLGLDKLYGKANLKDQHKVTPIRYMAKDLPSSLRYEFVVEMCHHEGINYLNFIDGVVENGLSADSVIFGIQYFRNEMDLNPDELRWFDEVKINRAKEKAVEAELQKNKERIAHHKHNIGVQLLEMEKMMTLHTAGKPQIVDKIKEVGGAEGDGLEQLKSLYQEIVEKYYVLQERVGKAKKKLTPKPPSLADKLLQMLDAETKPTKQESEVLGDEFFFKETGVKPVGKVECQARDAYIALICYDANDYNRISRIDHPSGGYYQTHRQWSRNGLFVPFFVVNGSNSIELTATIVHERQHFFNDLADLEKLEMTYYLNPRKIKNLDVVGIDRVVGQAVPKLESVQSRSGHYYQAIKNEVLAYMREGNSLTIRDLLDSPLYSNLTLGMTDKEKDEAKRILKEISQNFSYLLSMRLFYPGKNLIFANEIFVYQVMDVPLSEMPAYLKYLVKFYAEHQSLLQIPKSLRQFDRVV